jgi:hypothetical protein
LRKIYAPIPNITSQENAKTVDSHGGDDLASHRSNHELFIGSEVIREYPARQAARENRILCNKLRENEYVWFGHQVLFAFFSDSERFAFLLDHSSDGSYCRSPERTSGCQLQL